MRTVALVAALSLLAAALAGCSGEDPERYPDGVPSSSSASRSSSASQSRTSSSGTSTGPAGDANEAPTGSLTATVNGTSAAFNVTGSDADNDTLTWSLDFGDGNSTNGTALPSALQHNYTLPANTTSLNVTVVLTLSDGQDNATYNATLNLTSGAGRTLFTFTGSTTQTGNPFTSDGGLAGPQPGLGANGCAGFNAGESGIDCVFTEFSGLDGAAYAVTTDADTPDLAIWDSCDPTAGTATQAHGGGLAGTIPAGSGCVILWNFGTATATFTFTVTG